ncbi:capsular polysaccharide biosynthesis protein [Kluyvera sichuanensis]|uniref:capsular polysaccharide biosynthesis protein n=1 Tax=Kluyvera sichuanensis TaxID=2725494 RepID=UPI0034A1D756
MIGIYSSGLWKTPHLEAFLGEPGIKLTPHSNLASIRLRAIAVWGERPSAQRPIKLARQAGIPILRLEDGFTRSLGLGVNGAPPLAMVVDDLGIYYDARTPSRLEKLIQIAATDPYQEGDALRAIAMMVNYDLSKYNHAPPFSERSTGKEIVLVIDQTFGDISVKLGGADEHQFATMLSSACREHPQAEIWVKTHPDVLSGKKRGYFNALPANPRIRLFIEDVSPQSLLQHVSTVYTATSQYGIEALMAGKRVVCFGLPWYAGWGLTDDRHPDAPALAARRGSAPLTALVSAAWLRYTRYIDPYAGERATLFDVLDYLHLNRTHQLARRGYLWAPGMTLWKSSVVKPFLRTTDNQVSFSRRSKEATACIVWGIQGEARWKDKAAEGNLPIWRMEDGFLRSSGLGSDLLPPLSLVLDKTGIYYDATRPSDLEKLLSHSLLTVEQQQRASQLHQHLVKNKLSKYNLGKRWQRPATGDKRVLLVPGQVENDASIATGTLSINTNLTLLRTVRERHPDAFIIYKPHPDVLTGNRPGHITEEEMTSLADCVALDADIIECIQQADELHTMTSLSGFEALLHGKQVYCYGQPFYAGWGLTVDEHPNARRQRSLTLQDLIYQTLIAYPTYIHPHDQRVITAEAAAAWLMTQTRPEMAAKKKANRLVRLSRKAINFYRVKFK